MDRHCCLQRYYELSGTIDTPRALSLQQRQVIDPLSVPPDGFKRDAVALSPLSDSTSLPHLILPTMSSRKGNVRENFAAAMRKQEGAPPIGRSDKPTPGPAHPAFHRLEGMRVKELEAVSTRLVRPSVDPKFERSIDDWLRTWTLSGKVSSNFVIGTPSRLRRFPPCKLSLVYLGASPRD